MSPSRACLSNAMNVGHPSNLARFFDLFGGTVDRNGVVHRSPDRKGMQRHIYSVSITDGETKRTIKRIYETYGVLLEPHGAVSWRGMEDYLEKRGEFPLCISLETAHPAKFPKEINELLAIDLELPQSMKDVDAREGEPVFLDADHDAFRTYLLENLKG